MGSSYTENKNVGFWARDGQIQVWLYLLVLEIEKMESIPEWLEKAKDYWHLQSTVDFGGCVSANLDEIIDSEEKRESLIDISRHALAELENYGSKITLETKYSYGKDGPDTLCHNVDIRVYSIIGKAFLNLLQGKLKTDASSGKVLWPKDVPYG